MSKKAKGESIRQKLKSLSSKSGVRYYNVETVFLIERLVARLLTDKELSKRLVFKGGFVGLKVYNSPRYTVDLDALLTKANIEETLKMAKDKAETDIDDGVWFRFEDQIDLDTQGEYGGIRQVYRAGIGEVLKNLKKAQIVHFDLGIGDPITPGPQDVETQSMFQKGEEFSWSVYPIETICAEKLHALISHGNENSRSKDIHDLAIFLKKADPATLHKAIKRSFDYRETDIPSSFSSALKQLDTTMLERSWKNAVASVKNATSFKEAFETVVHLLDDIEEKNF